MVAKYLALCNKALSVSAKWFDISIDRELAEDLILNEGRKLKHLATVRLMSLKHVLPETVWQDSLDKDFNVVNSAVKLLTLAATDYNRLYVFNEEARILIVA